MCLQEESHSIFYIVSHQAAPDNNNSIVSQCFILRAFSSKLDLFKSGHLSFSSHTLCSRPLSISLVSPKWDAVLQNWFHKHQTRKRRHFTWFAGYTHANTGQGATSLLQYKDSLLADGQFFAHHDSQSLSSKAGFQLVICKLYQCTGLFNPTCRTVPGSVWLLTVPALFQPTKSFWRAALPTVICWEHSKYLLCLIIQFIKTILHRISLRTDPQRTWPVSSCQMDFVPSSPLRPEWHA